MVTLYTPIFFIFFCRVATLMDSCSLGGCTRLSQTLHPRTSRQGIVYFLAGDVAFGWPKWCEAQLYHVLSGRHFSVVEWRYFVTHLRFFQGPSFFDAYPTRLVGNMMGYHWTFVSYPHSYPHHAIVEPFLMPLMLSCAFLLGVCEATAPGSASGWGRSKGSDRRMTDDFHPISLPVTAKMVLSCFVWTWLVMLI